MSYRGVWLPTQSPSLPPKGQPTFIYLLASSSNRWMDDSGSEEWVQEGNRVTQTREKLYLMSRYDSLGIYRCIATIRFTCR